MLELPAFLQVKEATTSESHKSGSESALKRPWNRGRLAGAKPLLQPKHVWAILRRAPGSFQFQGSLFRRKAVTMSPAVLSQSGWICAYASFEGREA